MSVMSRRPKAEQEFGSDSFMDVICNVVGILIILMVLAGLRAGQAPIQLSDVFAGDEALATADVAPALEPVTASLGIPQPLPTPPAELEPVAAEPPRELLAAAENLERELAEMVGDHNAAVARFTAAREQQTALEDKLAAARKIVEQRQTQWASVQEKRASTTAELTKLKETVAQLATQVEQTEAVTPKLQQIEHRITPIGKEIAGKELHFHVLHGRVAVIPLEKLLDRLKDQIERRKDWLAKAQRHMGQVGPVDGFAMSYVVERDNMTVVDELRYGQGMFRISVSSWQLEPQREMLAEPVATAMQPGSRFYAALLEAGEKAALTFWVYPDSFAAFSELKRFCHAQNFLVAGRPLPEGQPISGSPGGSRSAGQ
jgi:hypothetical protein